MMYYIGYAIFGLVAGAIARLLHPGKDPMNWVWTMVLGIGGAEIAGALVGVNSGLMGFAAAVAASIVLLVAYNYFTTRNKPALSSGGTATSGDYKNAVFDDLSKGPR